MIRSLALGLATVLLGTGWAGAAQDYVVSEGWLSDEDFYRLVACAAPPGDPCARPMLHWPAKNRDRRTVTVRIDTIEDAFLGGKRKRAFAALERAVQYINAAGANISVARTEADSADVLIHFLDTDGRAPLQGTGIDGADGLTVTGARVVIWSRSDTHEIQRAMILFGTRLHIRHYESAMLEELTQALGLMTDIRNPVYEGVSIFSQDSNDTKQFSQQDLMVLRRHYPVQE